MTITICGCEYSSLTYFPSGKWLLREYLCSPLCSVKSINDRLDAIEVLLANQDVVDEATVLLWKIPNLERLLGKYVFFPSQPLFLSCAHCHLHDNRTETKHRTDTFLCIFFL